MAPSFALILLTKRKGNFVNISRIFIIQELNEKAH